MKKIFTGIGLTVITLSIILGIFICLQVNKLKPVYDGELEVSQLQDVVEISWDQDGVIHILGEHTDDVILASGYAAAHERLWQMEMSRRVAKGQLSEIFGDTTRKIDRFFLTIGLDSLTEHIYQNLSDESRRWLEKYAEGINTYIAQIEQEPPVEFILMKSRPSFWTPEDCLLQNRMMAWFLNFNWKTDLLYWQLSMHLPDSLWREISPKWSDAPDIMSDKDLRHFSAELRSLHFQVARILGFEMNGWGSNSWVISSRKSENGSALLANDPHLGIQIPSLWIEQHLRSPDMEVAGFSLPGSPGIIIGRNRNISWGLTNGMIDDSDYFIEKVDTLAGVYWQGEQKFPLKIRNVIIKSKDRVIDNFQVYSTSRGPLLNNLFPGLELSLPISLKWVGWEISDELLTFIRLAKSKDWGEFNNALQFYTLPAQNFVYADREGNIGYRLGGKIPLRSYAGGLLPQNGFDSKFQWRGWIPFPRMPMLWNPGQGFIITANNNIAEKFPYYLSEYWEPPYRAKRIAELIRENDKITARQMQEFQNDDINLLAKEILPLLTSSLVQIQDDSDFLDKINQLLSFWDYSMDRESIPAAIYETIQHLLVRNIFLDEMDQDLFEMFTDLPNFYLRIFVQVFQNENSSWFDNIHTPVVEDRPHIIRLSVMQALDTLRSRLGENLENWEWGNLHQLHLKHSLGQVPLTNILLNRGPYPVSGSGPTVNVGTYRFSHPFQMVVGPSLRWVMDWGTSAFYQSILPGGNSGNFLSEYYDNQLPNWRTGQLKKVWLDRFQTKGRIRLHPGSE